MLKWAVARVRKGRLVRQSTQVRQTAVMHQATKRRRMGHERVGALVIVSRSLSIGVGSDDSFIEFSPRFCNDCR